MNSPHGRAEGDVDKIVHHAFFANRQRGVFVEVGAARPDYLSISAHFRELGWKVIAIEPNPAYAKLHQERGYEVLQYACGDRDEDDVDFSVVDSHGTEYQGGNVSYESFSSLAIKDSYASLKPGLDVTKIKVKLRKLDTILTDHSPETTTIDIISVDVEGWEIEVLRGLTFSRFQPKVLIIENLFVEQSYRDFMSAQGYLLWRVIAPNDVYVQPDMLTAGGRLRARVRATLAAIRSRKGK